MADRKRSDERDLVAGDFSSWMIEILRAIRGERGSDVPSAGCTACCASSQFIDIGPDETDEDRTEKSDFRPGVPARGVLKHPSSVEDRTPRAARPSSRVELRR